MITMAGHDPIYQCQNFECRYIYDSEWGDPRRGILSGTRFEDVPEDWRCPYCGAGREQFRAWHRGGN